MKPYFIINYDKSGLTHKLVVIKLVTSVSFLTNFSSFRNKPYRFFGSYFFFGRHKWQVENHHERPGCALLISPAAYAPKPI